MSMIYISLGTSLANGLLADVRKVFGNNPEITVVHVEDDRLLQDDILMNQLGLQVNHWLPVTKSGYTPERAKEGDIVILNGGMTVTMWALAHIANKKAVVYNLQRDGLVPMHHYEDN